MVQVYGSVSTVNQEQLVMIDSQAQERSTTKRAKVTLILNPLSNAIANNRYCLVGNNETEYALFEYKMKPNSVSDLCVGIPVELFRVTTRHALN